MSVRNNIPIMDFIKTLRQTTENPNEDEVIEDFSDDDFERVGPGYYDRLYPTERAHNGYENELKLEDVDVDEEKRQIEDECPEDECPLEPQDDSKPDQNFNGIPDDEEKRGVNNFGVIKGEYLTDSYPPQTLVDLKDLPSIEAGPVWYQTDINDCWANATSALFYSEMIKRDPQAVYPSITWLVLNATNRIGKSSIKCNALALPFRITSKILGFGMLPSGILESIYADKFNSTMDNKIIYYNDMNVKRCSVMGKADLTDKITNIGSVYEQIARKFAFPQFVGDFNPEEFCLFEESFTKGVFGGLNSQQNSIVKANLIYEALSKGFTVYIEMYISLMYFAKFRHPKTDDYELYDRPVKYSDYSDLSDNILHAMLITGFKTIKGVPCFLVKNSFGRRWGVNGYFWMSVDSTLGIRKAFSFMNLKFPEKPLPFRTVSNVDELASITPLTGEIKLVTSNAPYISLPPPPPSTINIQPGQPQPLPQPGLVSPETEAVGCKQTNAVKEFKNQKDCKSCVDLYVKTRCKSKTPAGIKRCEDFAKRNAGYCKCICNTKTKSFFDFFKKSK